MEVFNVINKQDTIAFLIIIIYSKKQVTLHWIIKNALLIKGNFVIVKMKLISVKLPHIINYGATLIHLIDNIAKM